MSFRHPEFFWALLALPFFWLLLRGLTSWRRRASLRFGDEAAYRPLIAGLSPARRRAKALLFSLGLASLVVALAGPQNKGKPRTIQRQGFDLVIALDFSKSMLARDVRPSRIERAKLEILRLLDELDGERVGLIAFAGETLEFPMTFDYQALGLFLREVGPYDMPVGGTAIAQALRASARLLERSKAKGNRVVLLITDGEDHEGNPREAARELAKAGIRIYSVGIGSERGESIPILDSRGQIQGYQRGEDGSVVQSRLGAAQEGTLRAIARIGQGQYFRAKRGEVGIQAVKAALAPLRQQARKQKRVYVYEQQYLWALGLAFFFFLLEALLSESARRKVVRPSLARPRDEATPALSGGP